MEFIAYFCGMNTIRAVIFDLDGTLVDSLADIADAMNRTLIRFDYPIHTYESYKYFVGNGLKNLVYQCIPIEKRTEEEVLDCLSVMMFEYGKTYADKTVLYKGIPELLNALTEKGIQLAVLSNKADELTQKICNKLLKNWPFEIIMGASERFPRKPDPASALYIAQTLEINPSEILYAGDTNVDMKTARAAGMFATGVTWGFRTREELEENGANAIIDHPMELFSFFT